MATEQEVQPTPEPQISEFTTVKGAPPPVVSPTVTPEKPFGGDFDKLSNAYTELRTAYSGDLGIIKNKFAGFEQKLSAIDQMNQTLSALQASLSRPPEPAPAPSGQAPAQPRTEEQFIIPPDALYDEKALGRSIEALVSDRLKKVQPQTNPQQLEALLQKVEALAQNANPQAYEAKFNDMMEERLTRMALDREKADLLREYDQEVVDMAGYLAYKAGKSSYGEGMELIKQKFPNMFAPKVVPRPELPVDMLSSASSVDNGVTSLHRQYDGVMQVKSPSAMLMSIGTERR